MIRARLLVLLPLVVALACSSAGPANRSGTTRSDPNVISSAELSTATQMNLYAFVSAARPRWLEARRTTGFDGRTTSITLFVDGQRFGDVEQLRNMSLGGVRELRYFGVAEAQQRFNIQNLGAVINVVTK
jgi:hypothetical protein